MRNRHKTAEDQAGAQDQDAAPGDISMEQMFLAMMQKQQEIESFMLKMLLRQQTLEKELEQQKKELEKEREWCMKDEDWLRNIDLLT